MGVVVMAISAVCTASSSEEEGPRPIGGLAFIDEIEVTVVNVVVHVTGKGGRPVTDLKPEEQAAEVRESYSSLAWIASTDLNEIKFVIFVSLCPSLIAIIEPISKIEL